MQRIFLSENDPQKLKQEAEQCLENLTKWFQANDLIANDSKTNYMVFCGMQNIPDIWKEIKLRDKIIHRKNAAKYLGVILDSKLNFNEHISQICKGLVK